VAVIVLRALRWIAGVRTSQEFAEGALLGVAERIAEILSAVRDAGEPRKCGSSASSTRGNPCGSFFPEHPPSNRRTVFAGLLHHCSGTRLAALGPNCDRRRVGSRVFGNHAGAMP
jgi:hypothetical protein